MTDNDAPTGDQPQSPSGADTAAAIAERERVAAEDRARADAERAQADAAAAADAATTVADRAERLAADTEATETIALLHNVLTKGDDLQRAANCVIIANQLHNEQERMTGEILDARRAASDYQTTTNALVARISTFLVAKNYEQSRKSEAHSRLGKMRHRHHVVAAYADIG